MVETPGGKQTWTEQKTTFRAAYVAKRQLESAREGEEKPLGGSALFGAAPVAQEKKNTEGTPQMSNQMLDSLKGYLDNIAAAATQTAANGGPLAEFAASMAVSVDTVARQQIEIKGLTEYINTLKKKRTSGTNGVTGTGGNNFPPCKHCEAVGQTAPHRHNICYFDPRKNKDRQGWAKRLMEEKGVPFNDE